MGAREAKRAIARKQRERKALYDDWIRQIDEAYAAAFPSFQIDYTNFSTNYNGGDNVRAKR